MRGRYTDLPPDPLPSGLRITQRRGYRAAFAAGSGATDCVINQQNDYGPDDSDNEAIDVQARDAMAANQRKEITPDDGTDDA